MDNEAIYITIYAYALAGLIETARELMLPRFRRLPKLMHPNFWARILNVFLFWPVGIAINNRGIFKIVMIIVPLVCAAIIAFGIKFVLDIFIEDTQIVWTILFGVFGLMLLGVLGRR